MQRKPNVTLQSIKRTHEFKAINRVIVRPGGDFLKKLQPKTSKKLP